MDFSTVMNQLNNEGVSTENTYVGITEWWNLNFCTAYDNSIVILYFNKNNVSLAL